MRRAVPANTDDVRWHLQAELGDIEGARPEFTAEMLDWCSLASPAED